MGFFGDAAVSGVYHGGGSHGFFFPAGRVLGEDGCGGGDDGFFSAVGLFDGDCSPRGEHGNAGHSGDRFSGGAESASSSGLPEGKKRNQSCFL